MDTRSRSPKRIFYIIHLLVLASLFLSACGGLVIQGQSEEGGETGITITGDGQILTDQPDQSGAPILGENAMQVLLILIAFGVFVLILLMALGRPSGHTHS